MGRDHVCTECAQTHHMCGDRRGHACGLWSAGQLRREAAALREHGRAGRGESVEGECLWDADVSGDWMERTVTKTAVTG